MDALYRKSLRISAAAKGDMGAGKIVNLQSNDAGAFRSGRKQMQGTALWNRRSGRAVTGAPPRPSQSLAAKLWSIPQYLHMLWSGPFQILVVMGLLVRVLRWAPALAGLAVTVALIPLTTLVRCSRWSRRLLLRVCPPARRASGSALCLPDSDSPSCRFLPGRATGWQEAGERA